MTEPTSKAQRRERKFAQYRRHDKRVSDLEEKLEHYRKRKDQFNETPATETQTASPNKKTNVTKSPDQVPEAVRF